MAQSKTSVLVTTAAIGLTIAALSWKALAEHNALGKPPTIADVQAAYDDGAQINASLHDKDLKIVGVDCHPGEPSHFLCEVGFVKTDADPDRVYLDAALVEHSSTSTWKLLRGLCRRLI